MEKAFQDYLENNDWKDLLKSEFKADYFKELNSFVSNEYKTKTIFPPKQNIFTALNATSFKNVKVVIIGQDPYHGLGQAHGLCFSVLPPTKIPPSLRNIFKELNSDLKIETPNNGNLIKWADQGVLLLNSILTVEEAKPMSHQKKGWEIFTEKIIKLINDKKEHVVFIAWGNPAFLKVANVDTTKHLVLKSVHPSPLSAHRGFLGCKHFSLCNKYLKENNLKEINWSLN